MTGNLNHICTCRYSPPGISYRCPVHGYTSVTNTLHNQTEADELGDEVTSGSTESEGYAKFHDDNTKLLHTIEGSPAPSNVQETHSPEITYEIEGREVTGLEMLEHIRSLPEQPPAEGELVTRHFLNDAYEYGLETQGHFDPDLANVALDEINGRLKLAIVSLERKAEERGRSTVAYIAADALTGNKTLAEAWDQFNERYEALPVLNHKEPIE